jgi:CDP-diglyceride synthetase
MPGQLKKLFYNKTFVDNPDGATLAQWKISPWKIFALLLSLVIAVIFVYGWFFTSNKQDFYGNILFYAIILAIAILGIWIVGKKAWDFKQRVTYFLIAFILIWVFYWVLSLVFSYVHLMTFHMGGTTLWVIISLLAFLGAKRIDGSLDRNDVFFGFLVFLVCIGGNIPMNANGGFLANTDIIVAKILSLVKW